LFVFCLPLFGSGGALQQSNPLHDLQLLWPHSETQRAEAFDAWTAKHGKTYASEQERLQRQQIFHSNLVREFLQLVS
jgi:hypothetical protein